MRGHWRRAARRRRARVGRVRRWLGEGAWGRGIGTEALTAVTTEVFRRHDLTRIYALPFADHHVSIRVLEKAGYTLEGHLRQSAIKDGTIRDQLVCAADQPV